jgi:calcineurin-like phosphoesterase family protein
MNYYFTADTHFGHTNIIKYCNRPFKTIEEHNEVLINNWNKVVKPNDIIYHLGDFCFKSNGPVNYLKRLNGQIYFIWGNHDAQMHKYFNKYGTSAFSRHVYFIGDMSEITIGDQDIILNHYSMRVWNKSHYGSWHLYGHSHGQLPDDPHSLSLDVGVDCHNYTPISFEYITELMSKKLFIPLDKNHRQQYKKEFEN